ncbi:CU044_2847 family protein [Streptomyces sp. Root264]|uniref:CU044_2847 family protein n=1 Tax=Streptomyces sp. Root264 TaxID=1736503 RepID=UPI000A76A177|nr:CU044_2847 family protein [Streptomyces sp. Root264]
MASQVVSYALDADTVVQFEVEPTSEWRQVRAGQVAGQVDEATRPAVEAAQRVLAQIAGLGPDEVEVTFGIKVSGTANWLIAKAASEANFGVKLVWRPQRPPQQLQSEGGDGAPA